MTIAEIVPSERYSKVIKVNVPVLFYWNNDNEFDGIALEIRNSNQTTQERIAIFQLLDKLNDLLEDGQIYEC